MVNRKLAQPMINPLTGSSPRVSVGDRVHYGPNINTLLGALIMWCRKQSFARS
jgi:hypothetical protein